jgi:hypothetical protein
MRREKGGKKSRLSATQTSTHLLMKRETGFFKSLYFAWDKKAFVIYQRICLSENGYFCLQNFSTSTIQLYDPNILKTLTTPMAI